MSRLRGVAVPCVLLTLALAMAACAATYGPSEQITPTAGIVSTVPPATQQPAATLTFGEWVDTPVSFCTLGQTTGTDDWWLRHLASATLGSLTSGGWVPVLADKYEVSADSTTFTFYLRQGVTWHDGAVFTANDVLFTFSLILDPRIGSYYQVFAKVVANVEAPDDYTVVFHMAHPVVLRDSGKSSEFRSLVEGWSPVPKHLLDGTPPDQICNTEWATTKYVGLGPYRVVGFAPGEEVLLSPYEGYNGDAGPGSFDQITVRLRSDPSVLQKMLLAGELDMAQLTPPLLQQVMGGSNILAPESTSSLAVNLGKTSWPPADPYVQRALVEPNGETFVPYREPLPDLSGIIGDATFLPQHPETGAAVEELAGLLGGARINIARSVRLDGTSKQGNPVTVYLAPLGPESATANADELWAAVEKQGGFVIGTLVVEGDPSLPPGRAHPFAVRVHGKPGSPEIQLVPAEESIGIIYIADVTMEVPPASVEIPTAGIFRGNSIWCQGQWDYIKFYYPCW